MRNITARTLNRDLRCPKMTGHQIEVESEADKMKTCNIHSVTEYVDIVCKCNNEMIKDTLLFRGQPDKDKSLIPSIGRKAANGKALICEERAMVETAKYKLPTVFRRDLEPIELLALLQHHGIPTRLLDVSANALVGLYFACHGSEESEGRDGEVIVFKSSENDESHYRIVNKICNTYMKEEDFTQNDLKNLYIQGDKPFFVYAPSYSLRQNIQSGRYILFANKVALESDEYKMLDEIAPISKDGEAIVCRIIVPADIKNSIRKDLRLLGISRELLFLDNADMVCREIRERYSER